MQIYSDSRLSGRLGLGKTREKWKVTASKQVLFFVWWWKCSKPKSTVMLTQSWLHKTTELYTLMTDFYFNKKKF